MKISIIVAHNQQGIIGINGQIPWRIPEDLKRFKQLTMGKPIIMGRKTFESLGSKPLPGRLNIVVSSAAKEGIYEAELGVLWADSLPTTLCWLERVGYGEVFVIGGERLYREAIPLADTIYRTEVNTSLLSYLNPDGGNEVAMFPGELVRVNQWELTRAEYITDMDRAETWRRITE